MADDFLTNEEIAKHIGVSRYCLDKWKRRPMFQQRVFEITSAMAEAIGSRGIAELQNRVDALNERWNLMREVIEARSVQYADVPGGDTGLLVPKPRFARPRGKRSADKRRAAPGRGGVREDGGDKWKGGTENARPARVVAYVVDVGLLKELRKHEKQAAKELGRWKSAPQHLVRGPYQGVRWCPRR